MEIKPTNNVFRHCKNMISSSSLQSCSKSRASFANIGRANFSAPSVLKRHSSNPIHRRLPQRSVFSRGNISTFERFKEASQFGRKAALGVKERGFSTFDGIKTFKAQKQLSDFLSVMGEMLPVLQTRDNSINSLQDSKPLFPVQTSEVTLGELGVQIAEGGQALLLEQFKAEAGAQIADWLGISSNDQASLDFINTVLNGVTGQSNNNASSFLSLADDSLSRRASQVLGGIGAAYSAYELIDNWGNTTLMGGVTNGIAAGSFIGSMVSPVIGSAIGGVIGGAVGAISSLVHNGKHKDQKARDELRLSLQNCGFINQDFQVSLADGSFYDIGKDGGFRLDSLDGTKRAAYDVDFSNPLSHQAIGWIQPLATVLTSGNEKLKNDLTGYLVNAATSNATSLDDVALNVLSFMGSVGVSAEQIAQSIVSLYEKGQVSDSQAMAYIGGLESLPTFVTPEMAA